MSLADDIIKQLEEGITHPLPTKKPHDPVSKAADSLVKDETVALSEILHRNGWGTKNSRLNRQARGVIQCESSGNPDAYNKAPCGQGENAVGLMQVCTIHRGKMGIPRDKDAAVTYLKDADNNARVGRAVLRAQGWHAWTCPVKETDWDPTINVKKHSLFSPADAANAVTDPLLAPLDEIAKFFGLLTQADTWLRIGKVVMGASLLGMGALALILAGGKSVSKTPVGKAALAVTPVGKAIPK